MATAGAVDATMVQRACDFLARTAAGGGAVQDAHTLSEVLILRDHVPERDQQADGGWPITWEPRSEASALEWRGVATLRALLTLRSYGRLSDE